ncbi:MAG: isocitrate lyase/phosphoenolpyruvate mutase family protein [Rhodobacteraceae bacterium]|jgi:2-methylisocitrate lyase-like PEP mutase family enzyme|nr:isocitrate lyase/phosphoenolpyruvate mutase family protein [Paracoccaceae bacterium]
MTLEDRHARFAHLHRQGCFVMPNPWDAGSARMMAAMGAAALATSSAAHAFTLGRPDMGTVTRDEALEHAAQIIAATDLPVSGDFENGFGDAPEDVAETIRMAGEAGLSGCGIEDTQMVEGNPAYGREAAIDRIAAAVEAARDLGRPFILTARADGVMNGTYDMDEALARVQAFAAAGADCVYIPVLPDVAALERLMAAVWVPVNVLAVGAMQRATVAKIAAKGVRRISLGSQVARVTHAAIRDVMAPMLESGDFSGLKSAASGDQIDALLEKGAG